MSHNKPYTSSLPEVAAKQRDRAKAALKEQLPIIVELLLEDEEQLSKLAEALKSVQPTNKMKITKTD